MLRYKPGGFSTRVRRQPLKPLKSPQAQLVEISCWLHLGHAGAMMLWGLLKRRCALGFIRIMEKVFGGQV